MESSEGAHASMLGKLFHNNARATKEIRKIPPKRAKDLLVPYVPRSAEEWFSSRDPTKASIAPTSVYTNAATPTGFSENQRRDQNKWEGREKKYRGKKKPTQARQKASRFSL
jgi:hypothetical protein